MRQWCVVFLMAWGAAVHPDSVAQERDPSGMAERMLAALPATATGTFVQRKILADVQVTITSSGTFRFEKDKSFEWNTLKPLPSTFTATPESYTVSANGKTSSQALGDVSDMTEADGRLTLVPKTRELRDFVKRATLEGADFPTRFTLDYVTGDRLEIDLVQSR